MFLGIDWAQLATLAVGPSSGCCRMVAVAPFTSKAWVWQQMLAVAWDLRGGCQLRYLRGTSPYGLPAW